MAKASLGRRVKALRGEARQKEIAAIVSEHEASHLSAAAFCELKGIARVTLGRWKQELRAASRRQAGSSPQFVEVRTSPRAATGYEVTLPGGASLRVPSGFDEAELGRLLSVLRATC